MSDKLKLDQESLTFRELADIEDKLGAPLDVLFEKSRALPMAALAWVIKRRTEPDFTFDEAMELGPADLELDEPDPEVQGGATGAPPAQLGVPGVSIRSAS